MEVLPPSGIVDPLVELPQSVSNIAIYIDPVMTINAGTNDGGYNFEVGTTFLSNKNIIMLDHVLTCRGPHCSWRRLTSARPACEEYVIPGPFSGLVSYSGDPCPRYEW